MPDSDLRCPLIPGELQGVDLCDSWYVMINTKENQKEEETVSGNESIWNSYIYTQPPTCQANMGKASVVC